MKKILSIIGFLMFVSVLVSPMVSHIARGQANQTGPNAGKSNSDTYKTGCTFPFLTCGHMANIPDVDFSATFGTSDPLKAGQDLYKNVLQMTRIDPDRKAFKNTAGAFGTSESNMARLLENDFGPILDKNPYLTQTQVIAKMAEIQQKYQEEKDIFVLQADIDASVMPSEIFANGDTSDSGFDLINDLSNIENLLFKKSDPIDIGDSFADTSGSGGGGNSGLPAVPGSTTGTTGQASQASTQTGSASSGRTGTPSTEIIPLSATNSGLDSKPDAKTNPNICFTDGKLNTALQKFNDKKATDPNYKETPTTAQSYARTTGQNPAANPNGGSSPPQPPQEFDYQPPLLAPVKPAPASNWMSELPCSDVLCISVNFVKKPASVYVDSDNCVACHVEKINEKLKETINHSLIPGKATGNLIEPGICKKATADLLGAANMHFYVIAKPVITPTNDDLIYGTSVADEWQKFLTNYKPFPFDYTHPKKDTPLPTVEERATASALMYAPVDATFSQVNQKIQQQIQGTNKAIAQSSTTYETAAKTDTDASFYQSIQRELEQMNYYFASYKDILQRLHEKVGDLEENHPCDKLLNETKQCS